MVGVQLVVAAVVVDRLNGPRRLLAARRTRPAALAGQWELPGGKVEPGEQPLSALRRELQEELGVGVRCGAELVPDAGTTWPLTSGLELRAWWCEITAGAPRLSDAHDELRWLTATTLLDVPWLAPDRPLLDRVRVTFGRHLADGSGTGRYAGPHPAPPGATMSISPPPADDNLPEDETADAETYGSLSIEDDPEGTVDPGELAGGASDEDADVR